MHSPKKKRKCMPNAQLTRYHNGSGPTRKSNFFLSNNENEQKSTLNINLHIPIPKAVPRPQKENFVSNEQIPFQYTTNYAVNQAICELARQPMSLEKERVRLRLVGFEPNSSKAWKYISSHFGHEIKQHCLCEMAKYLSAKRNIPLDRDSKRRKSVLIKWFHENWEKISVDMTKFRIHNDELIIEDPDSYQDTDCFQFNETQRS